MALDIIVVLIFILSTIRGKVRGVGETLIHLATLVGSIALATLLTKPLSALLKSTPLDEMIEAKLVQQMHSHIIDLLDFTPKAIGGTLKQIGISGLTITVKQFTDTALLVLSFLLIILAVSLVSVYLRTKLRHARRKGTVIGTADSTIGFLFGMVRGAILVFLFLAFMFPIAGIFMPDRIQAVNESLNSSYIAGPLYDINPLILLIQRFSL
jgi:uncharacterized membrane protein required for colicin V production